MQPSERKTKGNWHKSQDQGNLSVCGVKLKSPLDSQNTVLNVEATFSLNTYNPKYYESKNITSDLKPSLLEYVQFL